MADEETPEKTEETPAEETVADAPETVADEVETAASEEGAGDTSTVDQPEAAESQEVLAPKERRARNHGSCVMPMVRCKADGALSVNWGLEPLTARCLQCEPVVLDIAWRYAEQFDVRLPEAQPSLAQ